MASLRPAGGLIASVLAGAPVAFAGSGRVLYDNGPPDGVGGVSNATVNVFGARRTLLDDFVIPDGETWVITGFRWEHIWNTLPPGSGSGFEILFRIDENETPGEEITPLANIRSYTEVATGVTYFSRAGAESWVTFEPIVLTGGTYWFEATIVGPENNFWLEHTQVNNTEFWVNYDDLGGLQSGVDIFGVASDLNFRILGLVACTIFEILPPEAFTVVVGDLVSGDLGDLLESDDERVVIRNHPPASILAPAIEVEFAGTSPAGSEIILTFRLEALSTAVPRTVPQRIDLFNFETDQWDQLDLRFATGEDSVAEVVVSDDAGRYVEEGTGRVAARVRWMNPGTVINAGWRSEIDQAVWEITPDCNENGVPDCDDIVEGTSFDCNANDIPDECETDCNGNGRADECDIDDGTSEDCNSNGIPDECEADCNGNGNPDDCDIDEGESEDCNLNGVPDECDIASGDSSDVNGNGVPDECECIADVTGNGQVDFADLLDVISAWGECEDCREDINHDGVVDLQDVLIVLTNWGPCDAGGPPV